MDQDEGNAGSQICDWCAQETDSSLAQCVWIRCPSCGKAPYHEACLDEWLRKIKYKKSGSRSEACYKSGLGSYPCPAGKGEIPRANPCKCKVEMTLSIPMKSAKADLKKAARIEALLRQQRMAAAAAGQVHAAIHAPTAKLKPSLPKHVPPKPASLRPNLNCEVRRGHFYNPCPSASKPAAAAAGCVQEALASPEPKEVPGAVFAPEARGKKQAKAKQGQQQQQQQQHAEGADNQPTGAEWGNFAEQQRWAHEHDGAEAHHNPYGGLHSDYPPAMHPHPVEPDPMCNVRDIASALGVHVKLEAPGSSQRGHCLLQFQDALDGLAAQGFDVESLSSVVCEQLEALAAAATPPCREGDGKHTPAAHPALALPAAEPIPRQASPLLPAPAPWPVVTPTPGLGGGFASPQAGGWSHQPSGFAPAAPQPLPYAPQPLQYAPQPLPYAPHTPALPPPLPASSRHLSIAAAGREGDYSEQQDEEDEDSDLHLELLALCLPCDMRALA